MYKYKETKEDIEAKGIFSYWAKFTIGFIILISIMLGIMNAIGLFGKTAVQAAVFQNSYQKKAADDSAIKAINAQLAEINYQLNRSDLSENDRADLEASAAALRVRSNSF